MPPTVPVSRRSWRTAIARRNVSRWSLQIGAEPIDAGPLRNARYSEPAGMLLVQLANAQELGGRIGMALVHYG